MHDIIKSDSEQQVSHLTRDQLVLLVYFQAIATNFLHKIPRSNKIMSKLNDEIDRVGRFLLEETSLQEGLSLERNERQKKTLLQKVWECIESFIRVKVIISNHSLEIS